MSEAPRMQTDNPLAPGDTLAAAGNWPDAVAAWQRAATDNPALRPAAERRLAWLLVETGQCPPGRSRVTWFVLAFLAASGLAMALFAIAGTPGTRRTDLVALAIWAMVAIAIAASLLAARRSGESLLDALAPHARATAERLDHGADPGDAR